MTDGAGFPSWVSVVKSSEIADALWDMLINRK